MDGGEGWLTQLRIAEDLTFTAQLTPDLDENVVACAKHYATRRGLSVGRL